LFYKALGNFTEEHFKKVGMKKLILLLFICLSFFLLTNTAEARSGCCSHHGGVCGCGCCDGTSLSTTCAPYYPSCNNTPVEAEKPLPLVEQKTDTLKTDFIEGQKTAKTAQQVPASSNNTNQEDSSDGFWGVVIFFGIIGYIVYRIKKKIYK